MPHSFKYFFSSVLFTEPSVIAFGKNLANLGANFDYIAESRMELNAARFMTLDAAIKMDTVGNKIAASEIAQIKVYVPKPFSSERAEWRFWKQWWPFGQRRPHRHTIAGLQVRPTHALCTCIADVPCAVQAPIHCCLPTSRPSDRQPGRATPFDQQGGRWPWKVRQVCALPFI